MSEKAQSFASHTRWNVLYHFVASPIALLNVVAAVYHAYRAGGRFAWWNVVFAVGILCLVWTARAMAISVQDRLIRLEMRLRLRDLLPPAMHKEIDRLTVRQMVSLRFAGDAELPELAQRVLKGELAGAREIKAAIKDWRPDWQRA